MEKIEKSEWYEAVKEKRRIFCFGLCNCVLSDNNQWLLVEDMETAPRSMYYKIYFKTLHEIYKSLRYLYVVDLKVMAGFLDKSMNTTIYESLSKKTFLYEGLEFRFDDIKELVKATQQ